MAADLEVHRQEWESQELASSLAPHTAKALVRVETVVSRRPAREQATQVADQFPCARRLNRALLDARPVAASELDAAQAET